MLVQIYFQQLRLLGKLVGKVPVHKASKTESEQTVPLATSTFKMSFLKSTLPSLIHCM